MNKLKIFFRTFAKSLSEPNYYNDIIRAKLSFSFKYFAIFYLILSAFQATSFSIRELPKIRQFVQDTVHELTTNYPEDLVITAENDTITVSGVEQPYSIPFPDSVSQVVIDETNFSHLAVLDTNSQVAAPDTLITVTAHDIIVRNPDGRKQSYPVQDISKPLTLDRNSVGLLTSAIQSYIDKGFQYAPFLYFAFLAIFQPLSTAFILLIYSLVILLSASILRKNISYKKSYQIGLHTITFAETVQFLQSLLFQNFDASALFPLSFFGASLLAVLSIRKSKSLSK